MFVTDTKIGVSEDTDFWTHFEYMFCHANIFHLAGNLLCLWRLKPRLHVPEAMLIATVVTWLPMMTGDNLTLGMSGVLFAICGIKWGQVHRPWGMMKYCGLIVLVTSFIPGMSWAVHVYALLAGFAYGWMLGLRHRDLKR